MNPNLIPKRKVEAELLLSDGSECRVFLFLAGTDALATGAERVSDLLADRASFLPALKAGTDEVIFINPARVAFLRVAPADDGGDVNFVLPVEQEVEITLGSGRQVRGTISYVLPPGQSRLLDHLNSPDPFLRLVDGDRVFLVNKLHVAKVATLGR